MRRLSLGEHVANWLAFCFWAVLFLGMLRLALGILF